MRSKTFNVPGSVLGLAFAAMLAFSATTFAAPTTQPAAEIVHSVEAPAKSAVLHPAASAAAASEHEENPTNKELDLGTLLFTIAVFVGLFLVLRLTAWKPIMAGLKSREQAIRDSIEAAQKARADADRTTRDLEAKMAEVQRQAAQQLTQAKADAVKIADTIRAQAEVESAAIKDRTLREIDAAKQQALGEINTHAAILATAVARKILQRQVTADDQQRLVEESLTELAKKN